MATIPLITWWNETNDAQLTSWPIGVIKSGEYSAEKELLIWNNRGGDGTTVIPDVINCVLTTKDLKGTNGVGTPAEDLIANKWTSICCLSAGKDPAFPVNWTSIGGDTVQEIRAGGDALATAGLIKGTANDGSLVNSLANYAKLRAKVTVPTDAIGGRIDFMLTLSYQFE